MAKLLSWFYHGIGFPILVMVAVLYGHAVPVHDLPVFIFLSTVAAIGMLSFDAIEVMIPMAFMQYYVVNVKHGPNIPNYSDYYAEPVPLFMILLGGVIIFGALAIYCCRHWKTRNRPPKRVRVVGYTLLLLSVALALNGMYAPLYTTAGTLFGIGVAISFLFFYFLFAYFMPHNAKTRDVMMQSAALCELLLALQTVLIYLTRVEIVNGQVWKNSLTIGWGTNNSLGGMLVMLLPPCFYLAAKQKFGLPYFCIGLCGYMAAILTMSRNAWLFGTAIFVLSLLCFLIFSPHKIRARLLSFAMISAVAVLFVMFQEELTTLFWQNIQNGFSDNGRYKIWEYAYQQFRSAFWFGSGFYDSYPPVGAWQFEVFPYLVHNTWLQILSSCGIVGGIAYLLHRLISLGTVLSKMTLFRLFGLLSVIALLLTSLLDVYLFLIYPAIAYSIFLVFLGFDAAEPTEGRLFGKKEKKPKKKKERKEKKAEAADPA